MARNIEIKAIINDVIATEQKITTLLNGQAPVVLYQRDIFYSFSYGRLKLRTINNHENELIFYLRPDNNSPKKSSYYKLKILFPYLTSRFLRYLFGIKGVVEKERKLYWYENIRIHLDKVRNIGNYIEFEYMVDEVHPEQKGYSKLNALMDKINLNQSCLCSHSYVDMMTQDEKYQGGAIIEREIVQSKASDEKIKTVKKESLASVEK